MDYLLPDLCDAYPNLVQVLEPLWKNFGGKSSFGGEIVTIKCHEDNSLLAKQVEENGTGKVLVVDGGGSMRCGLLGDNLAEKAAGNGWEGVLVNGCVRDVDAIARINIGVQALAAHPLKSVKRDIGWLNMPVTFGGITFTPGWFIYGDNNGLIVAQDALLMP